MASDKDIKYTVTAEDRFSRTFQTLRRELSQASSGAGGLRESFGIANSQIAAISVAAGAAGLAIRSLANDLDAFNDSADATGDSVENISGLEQVALRTGGNLDLVTSSLVKLNAALASAKRDSPAAQALQAIGLSADRLRQMAPSDALAAIATALQGYENNANKARIVQELFGKSLREVAPFLNDLAEAGTRVATVTGEQAKQAEAFNKQLFAMQANATNTGRSIAGVLLPAVNRMFTELNVGREVFGGFGAALYALGSERPKTAAAGLEQYATRLNEINRQIAALKGENSIKDGFFGGVNGRALKMLEDERTKVQGYVDYYGRVAMQLTDLGQNDPTELARRGRLPKGLPDLTDAGTKGGTKVSEAQRYLETLQRQGLQVQQLTEYERVLAELQSGRIEGLTPKLRENILAQAKSNDLARAEVEALNARVAAQTAAGRAEADRLGALDAGNKSLELEVQAIGLTSAALADVELARIRETIATKESTLAKREAAMVGRELFDVSEAQLQVLNDEIDALKRRSALLVDKVGAEAREEQRKANEQTAASTRDTLSESIAEGILEGARAGQSVMDTFWREVKAQAAKQVLQPIISPLVQAGNSLAESLFGNLAKAILGGMTIDPNGSGITAGDSPWSSTGEMIHLRRANGGGVRAGHTYSVNENGTETFIPATDGVILNARQTAGAQAAPTVHYQNVMHVNGDVSPQTIQLMQAMLARNNQALMRSMRTGGAWAG